MERDLLYGKETCSTEKRPALRKRERQRERESARARGNVRAQRALDVKNRGNSPVFERESVLYKGSTVSLVYGKETLCFRGNMESVLYKGITVSLLYGHLVQE